MVRFANRLACASVFSHNMLRSNAMMTRASKCCGTYCRSGYCASMRRGRNQNQNQRRNCLTSDVSSEIPSSAAVAR